MNLAIIQARMNSSRFPGKVLADLNGQPILKHVIDAVQRCKNVHAVIVATTYGARSAEIASVCESWRVPCLMWDGPEGDVLSRFAWVVQRMIPVDKILRVCGDSPLLSDTAADELLDIADCDYAGYMIDDLPAISKPTGYFAEVLSCEALLRLQREVPPNHADREHVTRWAYERPESYRCRWLKVPRWYHKAKIKLAAVDTPEDLERLRGGATK